MPTVVHPARKKKAAKTPEPVVFVMKRFVTMHLGGKVNICVYDTQLKQVVKGAVNFKTFTQANARAARLNKANNKKYRT